LKPQKFSWLEKISGVDFVNGQARALPPQSLFAPLVFEVFVVYVKPAPSLLLESGVK
jgi:hypothetical protein